MDRPEVGQTVYSLNVGNAARRAEQELTPYVVSKVGRKYFYAGPEGCSDWALLKYEIETWLETTEYSVTSRLFPSTEEYQRDRRREEILSEIKAFFREFGRCHLSLDQCERIAAIIAEGEQ